MCDAQDFEVKSVNYDPLLDKYYVVFTPPVQNLTPHVIVMFDDLGLHVSLREAEVACVKLPVRNEFHYLLTIVAPLVSESVDNYHE